MVRKTTAPTIFQAGTKDNVLPRYARAAVNFRILPGDSVAFSSTRSGRVESTRTRNRSSGMPARRACLGGANEV